MSSARALVVLRISACRHAGFPYDFLMSYQTLEVDLENGRVRPRGSDALPARARALLTIVEETPEASENTTRTMADALRGLNVIGQGKYTDLSTNKAHLDDLGQ